MDRYAVIGHPVAHSKSPQIHAAFARATGEAIEYVALLAPLDGFAKTVHAFIAAGGRGANVTVPFKQQAYALAQQAGPRAAQARAANVLSFAEGRIVADNTDGVGLLRDLKENLGCAVAGRRVLLMGAGGASWGVTGPLVAEGPAVLSIVNRTRDRAVALVRHFASAAGACVLEALEYGELAGRRYDLVINATSAGLQDAMPWLPPELFLPGALAYDMMYGKATPFLAFARAQGARSADGTGMLVEQAAESFYIWRGVRPQTAPVIAMLRAKE